MFIRIGGVRFRANYMSEKKQPPELIRNRGVTF